MDGNLITVEILSNGVLFKPALINTGCVTGRVACKQMVPKDERTID